MKIAFLSSDKARENLLADAFLSGARRHGHQTETLALQPEPFVGAYDVACMVGVKSRELFKLHRQAGVPVIYLDKGYSRHKRASLAGWEYWRMSINAHHPTARLADQEMPADRLRRMGWRPEPWRERGAHILIAGSSAKYHEFYGLREPTRWTEALVKDIRKVTKRPIIYRPKPSWREATAIAGTQFSYGNERTLPDELAHAHAVVTHGSNSCFEAILAGIPCVIVGDGVAKPISSTSLIELGSPLLASDKARSRWLANLAYWQWTLAEMHSGAAWEFLGSEIHA